MAFAGSHVAVARLPTAGGLGGSDLYIRQF